jgi:hypothetical protein
VKKGGLRRVANAIGDYISNMFCLRRSDLSPFGEARQNCVLDECLTVYMILEVVGSNPTCIGNNALAQWIERKKDCQILVIQNAGCLRRKKPPRICVDAPSYKQRLRSASQGG